MRRCLLILSSLLLLAFICGCSHPKREALPVTSSLKVGAVPIADCLQLYVAIDKGLFKKQGLDVQMVSMQSGPRILEAMLAKSVDIGFSSVVAHIIARSKGIPIVAFTGGPVETADNPTHALMVPINSSIRKAADLKGKTVALVVLRSVDQVMLRQYLEKSGVDFNRVKLVEIPFPQMEGVLKSGAVDAAQVIEPFVSVALSHKEVRSLGNPFTATRPESIISTYNSTEDWLNQHPQEARKFAAAISAATDYIHSHPQESRQVLLKYAKIPDGIQDTFHLTSFRAAFAPSDLQTWIDELQRQGIIQKSYPASESFKKL